LIRAGNCGIFPAIREMTVTVKQRVFLWAPSVMFIALVLGRFDRIPGDGLLFHVLENGFVSSVFLLVAAAFISATDHKSFRAGVVMWVLALVALFVLKQTVILTVHL